MSRVSSETFWSSAIENGGVLASLRIAHFLGADFDLAGRQVLVDGLRRAALDLAEDRDHELRAQPLGALQQRRILDHDLRQAVTIAHVEEQQRSHVADAMHPAQQHDVLADVGRAKRATGVSTSERT